MAFRTVPADRGFRWLIDAGRLLLGNPLPFLAMGLVVALISVVPIAGSVITFVFGPAISGGIMRAASEQAAGRSARVEHLWSALGDSVLLPRLVALCLPWLALLVALLLLGMLGLFTLLATGAIGEGLSGASRNDSPVLPLLFMLLLFTAVLFVYLLTVFATPRVVFGVTGPLQAMRDSLAACRANGPAIAVFVLSLVALSLLLGPLLLQLPQGIGALLFIIPVVPWVNAAVWIGYRDLFGVADDAPGSVPPPTLVA